ncbi:MAG: 4Fe-4S binding protein [Proteobacteria bacterium]|nr:4Fe-4S binding protein [Pseudomonadota bacterium]
MTVTATHRKVAEKFVLKSQYPSMPVTDSLLSLVDYMFDEREAAVVNALSLVPAPAVMVAKRAGMGLAEVAPILKDLADRCMILSQKAAGGTLYGFLLLAPGIFEFQMILSKNEDADIPWSTEFARRFEHFYDELLTWAQPRAKGKDFRFGRIIPVEKAIENKSGIMPLPTDRFSEIVERNTSFCLANVCACRQSMNLLGQGCNRGMDACSAMGWLADLAIEKGMARRVSREEFVEAKTRAAEQGLVMMVDNLRDPLQFCSCCTCCCGALRVMSEYNIPTIVAKSHFEAVIDAEACIGCGKCAKICPMDAITVTDKKARVDYLRCIGCGLCVGKCEKTAAMSLRERADHKPPSDNVFAYLSERLRETTGQDHSLLPGLTFDIGNLLYKASPFGISGPRYKAKKHD